MTRIRYLIIIAILVSVCSNAQNTRITYPIGDFKIDPINKIVYSEEMTGGSTVNEDGSITHWDGTVERRDPRINYETTSLIILGNFVTFKEYFPSKCSYYSKVLQVDLGHQDLLCVKDGSRLYTFFDGKGLHVINIKGYKHITDGTNIYRKWGNSWSWEKTTVNDIFQSGNIDNHPGQWRYVIDIVVPFNNDNKTVYYLPGPGRNLESGKLIRLYNSGDIFFADYSEFDRDKPIAVKMDSVFIYNYDTQQYELLDITQYRHQTQKTYIYKNRLYNSGIPVSNDLNLGVLEYIKSNFHQTYFLWDGKTLIHTNMLTNFREDKDNAGCLTFREPSVHNVDIKTLKVINKDMLVDENNIYYATHSEFVVIPMRELGIEVIVNTK